MNTATDTIRTPSRPAGAPAAEQGEYLFGKRESLRTFTLFCLLMILDFADRMVIAALLPSIRQEWSITDAQAGLLSSVLFIGMVLFAFPAAFAIDRWSRVKTASLMGVFWSIVSALGAFARNITQLAVTRAAVGIGEAGYAPAAYAWISAAFPLRHRQLALGTFSACQPIGMAIGVAVGGYIAVHFGWRHALGVLALPGFVVAWYLYRARDYKNVTPPQPIRDGGGVSAVQTGGLSTLRQIFRTRSLLLSYLSAAMSTFQWVPVFYFLPTYFSRLHGIPTQSASLMTSGLMLLSIPAIPLGGYVMDRWNATNPLGKLTYGPLAVGVGTLAYVAAFSLVDGLYVKYAFVTLGMFVMASGGTAALSMTQELVPPGMRALSGTCSIVILHLLGSAPGPFVTGLLSDAFGLRIALVCVVAASGFLSVVALLAARRFYLGDLSKVGHYILAPD